MTLGGMTRTISSLDAAGVVVPDRKVAMLMKLIPIAMASLIALFAMPALASAKAPQYRGAPMCITGLQVDRAEEGADEPDLRVNTIFWRAPDPMREGDVAAVYKTVRVGDVVNAYDEDAPDSDDWIGDAKVGASGGTLTFSSSHGAYHSFYKRGRC
jgi:hypothetical protein